MEGESEEKIAVKTAKANFRTVLKNMFQKVTQLKIDENTDTKINRVLDEFSFAKKNPYRDKKFGLAVAKFQTQGLTQLDLKTELQNLTQSEEGRFFREKFESIDKTPIRKYGIHGIGHNNRVAVHTMLIAKHEGLLENDEDNKIKDILLTADYYHDIGRIGNNGPHSKRSARRIEKLDLKFADGKPYTREDKNLVKFLAEGHEGKDQAFEKLAKKYKIPEQHKELAQKMLAVIKDADAVDRVRIDANYPFYMKTDLNPQYLRTDTSKRLLNVSYELEALYKNVKFENILSYKTDFQTEEKKDKLQIAKEKFENSIKVELSKMPQIPKKINKNLRLCKEKISYTGKDVKSKIQKILKLKTKEEVEDFEK